MDSEFVKLVVFVPLDDAQALRDALTEAGAGVIGAYTGCSFSSLGQGRFTGGENSSPAIGERGIRETVEEERIEVRVPRLVLKAVIASMKAAHPYEEVAYDIYTLEAPPL